MKIFNLDCYLVDDGTLDTVISVNGTEYRFSEVDRNNDGTLTDETFIELCKDVIYDHEWYMCKHCGEYFNDDDVMIIPVHGGREMMTQCPECHQRIDVAEFEV